jgi:hypothetical protein
VSEVPSNPGSQDLDVPYGVPADFAHVRGGERRLRAPEWLQLIVIAALLGSAAFVFFDGHYLWAALLFVAGTTFGLAFILRRMIGDAYDRL